MRFDEVAGTAVVFGGIAIFMCGVSAFARRRRRGLLLTTLPGVLLIAWVAYATMKFEVDDAAIRIWFFCFGSLPIVGQTVAVALFRGSSRGLGFRFLIIALTGTIVSCAMFMAQPGRPYRPPAGTGPTVSLPAVSAESRQR